MSLQEKQQSIHQALTRYLTASVDEHGLEQEADHSHLRDYQLEGLEKITDHLQNDTHGYCNYPTGSGKTQIFLNLVNACVERNAQGVPLSSFKPTDANSAHQRIMIVVPSKQLVEQTANRMHKLFPNIKVGQYYSEKKQLNQQVTVTTYESLNTLIKTDNNPKGAIDPEDVGLVVFDEAHRGLSDVRSATANLIMEHAVSIGFTASPQFSLYADNSDELNSIKSVNNTLGTEIHSMTQQELTRRGYLAPVMNIISTIEDDTITGRNEKGEPIEVSLSNAPSHVKRAYRSQAALNLLNNYKEEGSDEPLLVGKQGLIFTSSVDDAQEDAARINANQTYQELLAKTGKKSLFSRQVAPSPHIVKHPIEALKAIKELHEDEIIPAMAIDGSMDLKTRNKLIEAYEQGKIGILVSAEVLVEGVDLPCAEFAINEATTSSLVKALQRGGRITRTDANNPDKIGRIFDVIIDGDEEKRSVITYRRAVEKDDLFKDPRILYEHSIDMNGSSPNSPKGKNALMVDKWHVQPLTNEEAVMWIDKEHPSSKGDTSLTEFYSFPGAYYKRVKPYITPFIEASKQPNLELDEEGYVSVPLGEYTIKAKYENSQNGKKTLYIHRDSLTELMDACHVPIAWEDGWQAVDTLINQVSSQEKPASLKSRHDTIKTFLNKEIDNSDCTHGTRVTLDGHAFNVQRMIRDGKVGLYVDRDEAHTAAKAFAAFKNKPSSALTAPKRNATLSVPVAERSEEPAVML